MKRSFIAALMVVLIAFASAIEAVAAVSAWRVANECAALKVGRCSTITTIATSTRVRAMDGSCRGDVGIQVKYRKNGSLVTTTAIFAHSDVATGGSGIFSYRVWHV